MALMKCGECRGEVSDKALLCPHCGNPIAITASADSQSYTAPGYIEKRRGTSVRRLAKIGGITSGTFVVLCIIFQAPVINGYFLKAIYSSTNAIEAIQNVQQFFGKTTPQPSNVAPSNTQRQTSLPTSQVQQPQTVKPRAVAATPQAQLQTPSSPCSNFQKSAIDWANTLNMVGIYPPGKSTWDGHSTTTVYKVFLTKDNQCLAGRYTTWIEPTGDVYIEEIDIAGEKQNIGLNTGVWVQFIQPPVSQAVMIQELQSAIDFYQQNGRGPTAAEAVAPSQQSIPQKDIAEQSLVALLCYYSDGSISRGSGVIVSPQGYILTAKHIVDPSWTSWAYGTPASNATLDHCDVGIPPPNTLPTVQEIQTVNPSISVPPSLFPLTATLYFKPPQGQLSNLEYRVLDFAVLKITKPSANCASYNLCTLPSSYPYSPVYYSAEPNTASYNQLINFGYPGEAISTSTSNNFTTFNLKGAVGRLVQYYGGDQYFKNQPLNFSWSAIDVIPGRSGSPIFWNGYVVGIEYGGEFQNVTNDSAIGLPAIDQILKDNGLENILSTN